MTQTPPTPITPRKTLAQIRKDAERIAHKFTFGVRTRRAEVKAVKVEHLKTALDDLAKEVGKLAQHIAHLADHQRES
jgi:hypothetical protein